MIIIKNVVENVEVIESVKSENLGKMFKLLKALRDVGVEAEMEIGENGDISMGFTLWNTVNGNNEQCCIECSLYDENTEFFASVCPDSDFNALMKQVSVA